MSEYAIYPAIGVARLGNSDEGFFLAPDAIGGLPKECDPNGNEGGEFSGFRDTNHKIRRQAQKFKVYAADSTEPIKIGDIITEGTVESITWTVHLANKKAEWYGFEEQKGNLLYGSANSYASHGMTPRNSTLIEQDIEGGIPSDIPPVLGADRKTLIIDPGPRTISSDTVQPVPINRHDPDSGDPYPGNYPGHFPPTEQEIGESGFTLQGTQIDSLGELRIDSDGNLLVLGGQGNSQGKIPLDSYGGADTWYDDISDGSVTCTITTDNDSFEVTGKAWVIVGPPDFAPELVNIASWDDTIFDVAVRRKNKCSDIYSEGTGYNEGPSGFLVNYERDILPIIKRIAGYQWVANVQSMSAFFSDFNKLESSRILFPGNSEDDAILDRRLEFLSYFREPQIIEDVENNTPLSNPPQNDYHSSQTRLFGGDPNSRIPMMPLNSGSNSVSNYNIKKFMTLTRTQYFFLKQWANGYCTDENNGLDYYKDFADPKNRVSVGNVVGLPQCPGIEVTWTTQNPIIYDDNDVYRIKHHATSDNFYQEQGGLTLTRDECDPSNPTSGCEPGDLTKRMAIPWQADFFNCTIQHVNFSDPNINKYDPENPDNLLPPSQWDRDNLIPLPPAYYAYWWPPQAPWDVLVGAHTAEDQALAGDLPEGLQVNYMRGINSYGQMVNNGWSYLGFIRNQNADASGYYPYFVETERYHEMFQVKDVGVGTATQAETIFEGLTAEPPTITSMDDIQEIMSHARPEDNETTIKVFSLAPVDAQKEIKASRRRALNLDVVEDLFKEIKIAASHRSRKPRSGSKVRF